MKMFFRILFGVLTAPIWLLAGFMILCLCIPWFAIAVIGQTIGFVFTGEWDLDRWANGGL